MRTLGLTHLALAPSVPATADATWAVGCLAELTAVAHLAATLEEGERFVVGDEARPLAPAKTAHAISLARLPDGPLPEHVEAVQARLDAVRAEDEATPSAGASGLSVFRDRLDDAQGCLAK